MRLMSHDPVRPTRSLWLALAAAIAASALIGWIDQRNDEVQGTVILLIATAGALAFVLPRYGWLTGLIIGLGPQCAALATVALGISPRFPMHPTYAGLLALFPAAIGAVIGTVLRGAVSRPAEPSRR
jgi:hypothetical protein